MRNLKLAGLFVTTAAAILGGCATTTADVAVDLPLAAEHMEHAEHAEHAEPLSNGVDESRLQRLSAALRTYVAEDQLAGAVLLVLRDGQPIFSDAVGFRDKEAGAPMTEDTIFRIASQTKAIVSVGVMMLEEDGALLIEDPVGKYLPEWSKTTVAVPRAKGGYDVVPAERPITIRDLLTHTAGIDYGWGPAADAWQKAGIQGWYFAERNEPVSNVVARMASLPMAGQPGKDFVYGYGTDILGALIEKVSGKSLDEYLRERIFAPLGMNDTQFYLRPDQTDRFAVVYGLDSKGFRRAPDVGTMDAQGHYVAGPRVAFSGGAGLTSTAKDYARFLEMLRLGGTVEGVRVLGRKSVELLTANHLTPEQWGRGGGFGLGVSVTSDIGQAGRLGSVGEFGWGGAYHSVYWVDPLEGLTVVYMTQLIPADGIDDHGKIRALIYQALE